MKIKDRFYANLMSNRWLDCLGLSVLLVAALLGLIAAVLPW